MIAASNVAVFSRPALKRATRSRSQAVRASGNQVNAVTSITTTSTLTEQEKSLSKVDIKWGRTDIAENMAKYEFENLYRSGLPDEAVKVATAGMHGALAFWIRQQQIVAEEATQQVVIEKLKAQRALLAAEFEKEKAAALAEQKNALEAKYQSEINALKAAHVRETADLRAEIERLKALLAQAKADYDDLKKQYEDQLALLKASFAKREKELLDEIERLKNAVANALAKANAKYADAAKELEAALMLPIGQAVQRFKEIIDSLFEYQKQALDNKIF